ncbi:hypothetical protein HK405_015354, partial [Cladochytrium tenue]
PGKGASKKSAPKDNTNLLDEGDDSDEEYADEDDDGLTMDISDLLNPVPKRRRTRMDDVDDLASEGSAEGDADEGSGLAELVSTLNKTGDSSQRKRRKFLEVSESMVESEFNLRVKDAGSNSDADKASQSVAKGRLQLSDLLSAAGGGSDVSMLKKQAVQFREETSVATEAAPLPTHEKEKLSRVAAYDAATKQVTNWVPVVMQSKRADQLVFPAVEPPKPVPNSSALVSKFDAVTEMERDISRLLNISKLESRKPDELEMNNISRKELEDRRAQLAKIRSLMFFKEQKMKRISKIKSKSYRKLRRKDAERQQLGLSELMKANPDLAEEEIKKAETERIK